ncbi:hypothetical protein LIER_08545 [Lithospermum erythrorhizon]|uniref:Uncharacterized protein n=1 Tax=Lithospermum erythrorhizon TaxID=34254 RepID=A0AAV3PEE0_LITER
MILLYPLLEPELPRPVPEPPMALLTHQGLVVHLDWGSVLVGNGDAYSTYKYEVHKEESTDDEFDCNYDVDDDCYEHHDPFDCAMDGLYDSFICDCDFVRSYKVFDNETALLALPLIVSHVEFYSARNPSANTDHLLFIKRRHGGMYWLRAKQSSGSSKSDRFFFGFPSDGSLTVWLRNCKKEAQKFTYSLYHH